MTSNTHATKVTRSVAVAVSHFLFLVVVIPLRCILLVVVLLGLTSSPGLTLLHPFTLPVVQCSHGVVYTSTMLYTIPVEQCIHKEQHTSYDILVAPHLVLPLQLTPYFISTTSHLTCQYNAPMEQCIHILYQEQLLGSQDIQCTRSVYQGSSLHTRTYGKRMYLPLLRREYPCTYLLHYVEGQHYLGAQIVCTAYLPHYIQTAQDMQWRRLARGSNVLPTMSKVALHQEHRQYAQHTYPLYIYTLKTCNGYSIPGDSVLVDRCSGPHIPSVVQVHRRQHIPSVVEETLHRITHQAYGMKQHSIQDVQHGYTTQCIHSITYY